MRHNTVGFSIYNDRTCEKSKGNFLMTTVLRFARQESDSKEEGPNTWKGECGNIGFSREANSFVFLFSVRTNTSTTVKTVPKDPVTEGFT